MDLNLILPFGSTVVMLVFTFSVLQRWMARRRAHFLVWSFGLGMFAVASFSEAYFAAVGWSELIFFLWYFGGAVLTAAWIGHGTYWLLVPTLNRPPYPGDQRFLMRYVVRPILLAILFFLRRPRMMTGLLISGSMIALMLMLQVMPRLSAGLFDKALPISEQYRTVIFQEGDEVPPGAVMSEVEYEGEPVTVRKGIMPLGAPIRSTTIYFNVYGTLMLVGGALWSSWLFLRKQVLPNRVLGNMLIAVGALSIALASTLTRLGLGSYLYLGELVAAVLMYAGFVLAARPATEQEAVAETASAIA